MNLLILFIILVITSAITAIVYSFKLKLKQKRSERSKRSEISTDVSTKKDDDFLEIDTFNGDEYVNDIFGSVFYSIQNDESWKKELKYDKVIFCKEMESKTIRSKTVSIEFSYKFKMKDSDFNKRVFTIDSIQLSSGSYTTFFYKNPISSELKSFIYKAYSDWVNGENDKKRNSVDKDLSDIKSVLGKASMRGSKIDELLGE